MLITAGGDLAFGQAESHFNFLERAMLLLHGKTLKLENGKTITFRFRYSSVGSYLSEMKTEAAKQGVTFPSYHGDFFTFSGLTADNEEYFATA